MWLLMLLLILPSVVDAEIVACPGCAMGVYDDPGLSHNFGFWDPVNGSPLKSIWVGISYDSSVPSDLRGLTSIELSIDGIPPSQFGPPSFFGIPDATVWIGRDIRTPDDENHGVGGVNMAWNVCLTDNRALIRIDMLSFDSVGNDIVITVRRKFPPSSQEFPVPQFGQCDTTELTRIRVSRVCYVLNPTVNPGGRVGGCDLIATLAVEEETWSTIKSLYRN